MSKDITTLRELTANGPCLVIFGAKWAPPSVALDKIWRKSPLLDLNYLFVDVEESSAYADFHNVVTIPTVLTLYNGRELDRKIGALTYAEVLSMGRVAQSYDLKHTQ